MRAELSDQKITKGAMISKCQNYRYTLSRIWEARGAVCTFIMLNPSTADENTDDPTIRRCMGFARRLGCGSLWVVNLFAFRATSPSAMKAADDPVGPGNDIVLAETFTHARYTPTPVIAAWGAHGDFKGRADAVAQMALDHSVTLQCLGRTTSGAPRHPLYLSNDAMPEPWRQ